MSSQEQKKLIAKLDQQINFLASILTENNIDPTSFHGWCGAESEEMTPVTARTAALSHLIAVFQLANIDLPSLE